MTGILEGPQQWSMADLGSHTKQQNL